MIARPRQTSYAPEVQENAARRLLAVLNACHPGAWAKVGGIPLTARALFHLRGLGIEKAVVLLSTEKQSAGLDRWQGSLELRQVVSGGDIPATILSLADLEPRLLYIDTAHLMDARLMHALSRASGTTLAYIDRLDREKEVVRAGLLEMPELCVWARHGSAELIRQAASLCPDDMDPFSPEIRGNRVPFFVQVHSGREAREATRILIRSQQKQVMDLPAQCIDPPFENALTLLLCHTPVTPNMVTLFGVAVAAMVAWLFWHGYFVAGALCTFLVEILDGVDGKLARTKLQFSKLGRHEDVIDYIYENSWYVALAVGLGPRAPERLPAIIAGLLIVSDTADNIFYTLAGKWYGKSIDLFSPFDRAFRRIAGRRNIYGAMFIIGFSLGYPLITFAVVAAWAALTAGIHGLRLIQHGRTMKKTLSQ